MTEKEQNIKKDINEPTGIEILFVIILLIIAIILMSHSFSFLTFYSHFIVYLVIIVGIIISHYYFNKDNEIETNIRPLYYGAWFIAFATLIGPATVHTDIYSQYPTCFKNDDLRCTKKDTDKIKELNQRLRNNKSYFYIFYPISGVLFLFLLSPLIMAAIKEGGCQ